MCVGPPSGCLTVMVTKERKRREEKEKKKRKDRRQTFDVLQDEDRPYLRGRDRLHAPGNRLGIGTERRIQSAGANATRQGSVPVTRCAILLLQVVLLLLLYFVYDDGLLKSKSVGRSRLECKRTTMQPHSPKTG